MPSTLYDALSGSVGTPAQSGLGQNFVARLNQFRDSVAPIMGGMNPRNMVQSLLAQRGFSPAQIQQTINQYAAQATAIQKQLMGG